MVVLGGNSNLVAPRRTLLILAFLVITDCLFQFAGLQKQLKIWIPFATVQRQANESSSSYGQSEASLHLQWEMAPSRNASDANKTAPPGVNSGNYEQCRFLVLSRGLDYHNEVIESIAMEYPLDWEAIMIEPCQGVGLTKETPIQVDFYMGLVQIKHANKSESYGWAKTYFWPYLQGRIVQRPSDGRWIQFGKVLDWNEEERASIDWSVYRVQVENNCGWVHMRKWLNQSPNNRCVFHGSNPQPILFESKGCYLNPQWSPKCWFLPSHLPQLPPPNPPSSTAENNIPLRICVSSKNDRRKFYRNYSLLIKALQDLQPDPETLHIILLGRAGRIPPDVKAAGVNHYFHINATAGDSNYFEFQRSASQCHVMLPLIHPDDPLTQGYFKSATDGGSALSGMMSQVIGLKVPSLLHADYHAAYKDYLTAPAFVYNGSQGPSFTDAFLTMLKHYNYTLEHKPAHGIHLQPEVPKAIHLIYVASNETCTMCPDGRDIHDILSKKDPPKLHANMMDIIDQYTAFWGETPVLHFAGTRECHGAIWQAEPELLKYYKAEKVGAHKSDLCRIAQLYLYGGYYMDNDTKIIKPFVVEAGRSFSTVIGLKGRHFAQGFIAATPKHPVLRIALDLTLQHYRGIHKRMDVDYEEFGMGTWILYDAYHEAIEKDQNLKRETVLLEEKILKKMKYMEQIKFQVKQSINFCTAGNVLPSDNQVYMLARAPGTSYC